MILFSSSGIKISLTAYMCEFFDNKHRSKYITLLTSVTTLAMLISPLLGTAILTTNFQFTWFSGFVYRPWRLYVFLTSLIVGLTSIVTFFLPESPSFSMAIGRHREAMHTLQTMYYVNTGRSREVKYNRIYLQSFH